MKVKISCSPTVYKIVSFLSLSVWLPLSLSSRFLFSFFLQLFLSMLKSMCLLATSQIFTTFHHPIPLLLTPYRHTHTTDHSSTHLVMTCLIPCFRFKKLKGKTKQLWPMGDFVFRYWGCFDSLLRMTLPLIGLHDTTGTQKYK